MAPRPRSLSPTIHGPPSSSRLLLLLPVSKMEDYFHETKPKEEEEELLDDDDDEALSLRDLPLTTAATASTIPTTAATDYHSSATPGQNHDRLLLSPVPAEFFDFLTNFYPPPPPRLSSSLHHLSTSSDYRNSSVSASSSSSSSSSTRFQTQQPKLSRTSRHSIDMMRPNRWLGYRKLRRNNTHLMADTSTSFDRDPSGRASRGGAIKSANCSDSEEQPKKAKLPWYRLMFGLATFQVEMELKDIKRRQQHRRSNSIEEKLSCDPHVHSQWKDLSSSWRLISCDLDGKTKETDEGEDSHCAEKGERLEEAIMSKGRRPRLKARIEIILLEITKVLPTV
ncbi:hypothetical protein Dimus_002427 [Dionaea muscipula]